MAGLEGLEPPTKGLGNLCSIHLSYSPVEKRSYGAERSLSTGGNVPESYRVIHRDWSSLLAVEESERQDWRRLETPSMEVDRIVLRGRRTMEIPARPGESFVQCVEGRAVVVVMGNEIQLEPERCAVVPPNMDLTVSASPRLGATLILVRSR